MTRSRESHGRLKSVMYGAFVITFKRGEKYRGNRRERTRSVERGADLCILVEERGRESCLGSCSAKVVFLGKK